MVFWGVWGRCCVCFARAVVLGCVCVCVRCVCVEPCLLPSVGVYTIEEHRDTEVNDVWREVTPFSP